MRTARCLVLLALAAGAAHAADVRIASEISIAHCLDVIDAHAPRDARRCPAFLIAPLTEAKAMCSDVGGKLEAGATSDVWALDVDADGRGEYAFELANNAYCEGAADLFSCGSLGCAKTLYRGARHHDDATGDATGARHPEDPAGAWHPIGQISAAQPELVDVVPATAIGGYGELRIRCLAPCAETVVHAWTNAHYTLSHIDVRGHRVDTENSPHGLFGLVATVDVLAEPKTGAASVGRYDAGTDVAVIGTAGDYFYVSPCNACDSGFVAKEAARALYP